MTEIAAGLTMSNGPPFSPGGEAAYFADTFGRRLPRIDLDTAGPICAQAIFMTIPADIGCPDGMTVDSAGTAVQIRRAGITAISYG